MSDEDGEHQVDVDAGRVGLELTEAAEEHHGNQEADERDGETRVRHHLHHQRLRLSVL